MYDLKSCIFYNRGGLNSVNTARSAGAVMTLQNYYGSAVGQLTMNGNLVHRYVFDSTVRFAPTGTPTVTPTGSGTRSPPGTASFSVTATGTGTATTSYGVSASGTGTASNTPSVTPSPSTTSSMTPSITGSPLSTLPGSIEITNTLGFCLYMYEIIGLDINGRVVTASIAGGSATLSSLFDATHPASNAIDMRLDPIGLGGSNWAGAQCSGDQSIRVNFYPTALARVIYINRGDQGLNNRITAGGGQITVRRQTGPTVFNAFLTSGFVQDYTLAPFAPLVRPDATSAEQTNEAGRASRVRFVRINSAVGDVFAVREVMVLDSTLTNVARGAAATLSYAPDSGSAAATTDMVFDFVSGGDERG
jgi:hypothetical protein